MWVKTFTKIYPGVRREDIWLAWADVNHWPQWDKELDYCELKGEFSQGNHFILKPKDGPKIKMILSEVAKNESFTDCCKFWGATMYDTHTLKEVPQGLQIENTIMVRGPLAFLWVLLVAKAVAQGVPAQTDSLVEFAKTQGR